MVTSEEIWKELETVMDPEVPVLSVLDLGVIRSVDLNFPKLHIRITPTYSGCPAMKTIEEDIIDRLKKFEDLEIEIETVLHPAWTTDWLSEEGRKKLKMYGIAPPENEVDKSVLFAEAPVVPCPHCNSSDTRMISQFGSTSCKAHYQCNTCQEPFDYFKCLR